MPAAPVRIRKPGKTAAGWNRRARRRSAVGRRTPGALSGTSTERTAATAATTAASAHTASNPPIPATASPTGGPTAMPR